jgi:holo-[acyl-carrier protein] synthase
MVQHLGAHTMVVGAGVDIVEIDRFRRLEDKEGFFREVLTNAEISSVSNGPHQETRAAALFALKEATLKALGCGLHGGLRWHEVEVSPGGEVKFSGHLASLAMRQSVTAIHSSQSCSENRVVAFVLLENNRQEETHEQRRIVRDEIQGLSMETI